LHEENPASKVHQYSKTTASGTLRTHLFKSHQDEWVSECQRLNIEPRGKEGEEALANFMGLPVQRQAEARTPFSQVAFLDALVQLIVGTNQVFFISLFFPI
jgi:hypothetical protein